MTDLAPEDIPKEFLRNKEDRDACYAVCKACDKFVYPGICSHCSCVMALKTWIKSRQCPENKW
jgi:hypothetical protein